MSSKEQMTLKERLYMPPIEKYEKYGIFPWKIVIHFLLVAMTTCQTLLIVLENSTYSYSQYLQWNKLFCNDNVQGSDTSITNSYNLFSPEELMSYVEQTVTRYFDINSVTIDNYSYDYTDNGDKKPVHLMVKYINYESAHSSGYTHEYKLTPQYLGPFTSKESTKDFLKKVKRFELSFSFYHHLNSQIPTASTCYLWTIRQEYDYSNHGPIDVSMATDRSFCKSEIFNPMKKYVWIGFAVIILSSISMVSIWYYIMKRVMIISKVRQGPTDFRYAWESLSFHDKLKLANFWILFNIIGNITQFFSGIVTVVDDGTFLKVHDVLIGLGTFCAWVGIVQYLDHTSKTYTIINTIKRSFSTLGPYLVGILPIFMAYVFLAMCLFWKSGVYTTTTQSMVAAFALINGDSVYLFFSGAYDVNSFLGQLYMYTFIVFFICCVHNIFIAIIQSGFGSLSERPPKKEGESDEEQDLEKEAATPSSPSSSVLIKKKRQTVREIDKEVKERRSKDVFKKLIIGEAKTPLIDTEENTQKIIDKMDENAAEIEELLHKLQTLAFPLRKEEVNREQLKTHMEKIIHEQLDYSKRKLTE